MSKLKGTYEAGFLGIQRSSNLSECRRWCSKRCPHAAEWVVAKCGPWQRAPSLLTKRGCGHTLLRMTRSIAIQRRGVFASLGGEARLLTTGVGRDACTGGRVATAQEVAIILLTGRPRRHFCAQYSLFDCGRLLCFSGPHCAVILCQLRGHRALSSRGRDAIPSTSDSEQF